VAHLFEQRDLISAPVVDENNQLIGRITIDDVVDVIRDEAEHSVMSMAGLDEEEQITLFKQMSHFVFRCLCNNGL
jgi:magnesium transporter